MYPAKTCKEILKKKGVLKGISKHNKNQLNKLFCSIRNQEYPKRKNEKNHTLVDVVSLLTKNESITNHSMPYIINLEYLHDKVHFHILNELQLSHFASFFL